MGEALGAAGDARGVPQSPSEFIQRWVSTETGAQCQPLPSNFKLKHHVLAGKQPGLARVVCPRVGTTMTFLAIYVINLRAKA